jgi:hypothetical protein
MPVVVTEGAIVLDEASMRWVRREVRVAHRWRIRVVSDLSRGRSHTFGHGEAFELVVDTALGFWVRPFGSDGPLKRDDDQYGVAVVILDDGGRAGPSADWPLVTVEGASHDGEIVTADTRMPRRCELRVVSDREFYRGLRIPERMFGLAAPERRFEIGVDANLRIFFRALGSDALMAPSADADGVSITVEENVTLGVEHVIRVTISPASEGAEARWKCSCDAGSRGLMPTDQAQAEADLHVVAARESFEARVR